MAQITVADELDKADELRQRGVISQEEFDAFKVRLLGLPATPTAPAAGEAPPPVVAPAAPASTPGLTGALPQPPPEPAPPAPPTGGHQAGVALRLKWYERRTKGMLHENEHVVAAIHAHTSYLLMRVMPSFLDPLIGRHVVVTNERTLVFGPGMRKIIAEYPRGGANASRTGYYLTIGNDRMFVGAMFGPMRTIADQVVDAANSAG